MRVVSGVWALEMEFYMVSLVWFGVDVAVSGRGGVWGLVGGFRIP